MILEGLNLNLNFLFCLLVNEIFIICIFLVNIKVNFFGGFISIVLLVGIFFLRCICVNIVLLKMILIMVKNLISFFIFIFIYLMD